MFFNIRWIYYIKIFFKSISDLIICKNFIQNDEYWIENDSLKYLGLANDLQIQLEKIINNGLFISGSGGTKWNGALSIDQGNSGYAIKTTGSVYLTDTPGGQFSVGNLTSSFNVCVITSIVSNTSPSLPKIIFILSIFSLENPPKTSSKIRLFEIGRLVIFILT